MKLSPRSLLAWMTLLLISGAQAIAADPAADKDLKTRALDAGKSVKSAAGPDKTIKSEKPKNSQKNPQKEKKTRGNGFFRVYNDTGWYMDVYEDGYYAGTISPYSYETWRASDTTSMHCKVVFDDGTSLNWYYSDYVHTGEVLYVRPSA